jgi:hypothetical protein
LVKNVKETSFSRLSLQIILLKCLHWLRNTEARRFNRAFWINGLR